MRKEFSLILLATAVCASSACTTYRPPVVAFVPPASTAVANWDSIFAHPQPVTVTSWVTAEVKVQRGLLLDRTQPAAAALPDDNVWVPAYAHRIAHATKGVYLVDAGFDHSFTTSGRGNIGGLAVLASPFMTLVRQTPATDTRARLAAGHDTLRGVFFTHLHLDHTAGVPDLPKEVPYVAGKGALADSYESGIVAHIDHLMGIPSLAELDFSTAPDIAPLGRAIDLLGDGSVWAIHTPGHSSGHVSYLVNAISGPVLLLGDASHTKWGFEHNVAPGKVIDATQARATLERLRVFAARYPAVRLVFGHEPM
jgi:glyoxylase-like metal-dependent hydrolase (beta-lactamase superfamily II)